MTPPAWIDVEADLVTAQREAERASAKHRRLSGLGDIEREDAEIAIGKHLHDAYCAAEKAIERILDLVDGGLPAGASYHRLLLRIAAEPNGGMRPALISAETLAELSSLLAFRHAFRHAYGRFDMERAAPNVAVAAVVIPRLRDELTAFAASLGLAPRA